MIPLTPESAERLRFPTAAGAIPNSSLLYYEVSSVEDGAEVRTLWVCDKSGGSVQQIAPGLTNPRWAAPSPDGQSIAFVADVDGTARLWRTAPEGVTEPILLPSPEHAVTGPPAWSVDSRMLAFTALTVPPRDRSRPYRITRESFRYEGIGLIDDAIQDVFGLDVETGLLSQLTDDRSIAARPRWAPDRSKLLFLQMFRPDEEWVARPRLRVVDLDGRQSSPVPEGWGGVFAAEWTPDGDIVFAGIAAMPGAPDMFFTKQDLWIVGPSAPEPRCLTTELPAGVGISLEFDNPTYSAFRPVRFLVDAARTQIVTTVQVGGDAAIARIPYGAGELVVDHEPHQVRLLADLDGAGGVVSVVSTLTEPPEVEYASAGRVTELNAEVLSGVVEPRIERFEVAVEGHLLDAWALLPPGEGPFPVVLCVHGGPSDAYGNVFMIDHHLLVGAGIGVVFSNFRGSAGYGNEFFAALEGRWGPVGEIDHHATLDRAIELGFADPQRVGVYGLSHGGFAAMWLGGRSDRFRAAVSENGMADFVTELATIDAPWWLPPVLPPGAFDSPLARELSPISYANSRQAATLLIVGEDDVRCPPAQSEQFFRQLRHLGVDAEMLRLPGAQHVGSYDGPPVARRAQNEALVEWFSRYLG